MQPLTVEEANKLLDDYARALWHEEEGWGGEAARLQSTTQAAYLRNVLLMHLTGAPEPAGAP